MPMSARDSADSALANAWTDAQSNEFAETYSEHDDESENMHAPTEPANESTSQVSSLDLSHDTSAYARMMRESDAMTPASSSSEHISASSGTHLPSPSSTSSSGSSSIETALVSEDGQTRSVPLSTTTASTSAAQHSNVSLVKKRPGQPQFEGFWQVQSLDDLRPMGDCSQLCAKQRRADPAGGSVSPLKALTSYLHHTYHLVNPAFVYELAFNPRRVLTKPSKPMHNSGYDNEDSDYILYVNDYLGSEEGHRYLILDVLGQGTFGQVVKCQNMSTHEIVAVKVIKNKPAYFNQSMMEVTILETLNQHWDPNDRHNILRLRDTFIHHKHLCLVFELLSSNLYELIKQNSFRGLSTSLVRVFIMQLLDALVVLKEARLIHCDLKPENILLRTLQAPSIKLVDFGSACHEEQTVYTYIQSRFYRSPEVLLGLPYTASIDMWSLGCIAAELFLGLPIFPGTSEYNQLSRIISMLGMPPAYMLERGRQTHEFFNAHTDSFGRTVYQLKPMDQFSREHRVQEQASKQYFPGTTLPEVIRLTPISRRSSRASDAEKEMANRAAFTDFVAGLLNLNPLERWTPQQAKLHPFITGEPFTEPWQPPDLVAAKTAASAAVAATATAAAVAATTSNKTDAVAQDSAYSEPPPPEDPYVVAEPYARANARAYMSPSKVETRHLYHMGNSYRSHASRHASHVPMYSYDHDPAWGWSPAPTPLASVPHAVPSQGVAYSMYSGAAGQPPAAAQPAQGGFAVVVHGNEPSSYAMPEHGMPSAEVAYGMSSYAAPYDTSHDAVHAGADPYAQPARYSSERRIDPHLLPMYVNQR